MLARLLQRLRIMTTIGRLSRLTGNWIPAALARPFGAPTAVFFHGVEQRISDPGLQVNQHRLDAFEDVARLLKRDFDVLPLHAMADVLKRPEKHSRALFLMSDDGYANTLTTAAPILKAYGLPWTLFISTHHIDTGEFTPPTLTRIFFLEAPKGAHDLPHFDAPIFLRSREQREAEAMEAWKHLKNMPFPHALRVLDFMKAVLAKTGIDINSKYASENFLTWDQVRALDRAGVARSADDRLRLAGGAPGTLLGTASDDEAFTAAKALLAAAQSDRAEQMKAAFTLGGSRARGFFSDLLDALTVLLHQRARDAATYGDRRGALRASRAIDAVEDAKLRAAGNVNPQLLGASLVRQLAEHLA